MIYIEMTIKLSQLKIGQLPSKNKLTLEDMKKVEFAFLICVQSSIFIGMPNLKFKSKINSMHLTLVAVVLC